MLPARLLLALGLGLIVTVALGCNPSAPRDTEPSTAPDTSNASDDHDDHDHADHDHADHDHADHDHADHDHADPDHADHDHSDQAHSPQGLGQALAALSAADRQAALQQKICPVSEHALGGMGTPIKVQVSGRDVFLCCEGCEQKLRRSPQAYLAKLDD